MVQEVKGHLQGYTSNEKKKKKTENIKPHTSSSFVMIKLHPTEEEKPKDIVVITKQKRKENERTTQLEVQRFKHTTK